jgi:serine/threonine kinase 38
MNHRLSLEELLKQKKISQRTYDKVTIGKQIIERKYNLKSMQVSEWSYIFDKINSFDLKEEEKEKIKKDIFTQESSKYRFLREKQTIRNYESLAIIGRGAFGEVHVCRDKSNGEIVAIKKIKKEVLYIKNQVLHIRNEQILMSKVRSPWIVELKASFQEDDYLYLVMEFLPGGDLMNLLIKKDILTEDEARFYIAELILSIESIHKLDCIHRDIKPDNILIDKTGHIKLSDFGLAKISEKLFEQNNIKYSNDNVNKHERNYSCVGTAYYVAPEVLTKSGYGPEIDWWSVGVIFFEMLVGYAPFCSKETSEVCHKILNWEKYLKIPSKIKISPEAEDLISKLINHPDIRLGINGVEEIKSHPFFKGIDWENIRESKAPFIPKLKNDYDTCYFDLYEKKEPFHPPVKKKKKRKDIEYLGYTFKEDPKNNIGIYNEFQLAMKKLINLEKEKNSNSPSNYCTQYQSKISSKTNESKICLKNDNKNQIAFELNKPELNNENVNNTKNDIKNKENLIISTTENNIKTKDTSINTCKEIKTEGNKEKKKETKLNIIQIPTKKVSKNIGKKLKITNNKLITIKNAIKNSSKDKIIKMNHSKIKDQKKVTNKNEESSYISGNNSCVKNRVFKLSPSPNQKNIFLKKSKDKDKLKQNGKRGISDENSCKSRIIKSKIIKKSISQYSIKKMDSKNKSIVKKENSKTKNSKGKTIIYNNNDKNVDKNCVNIGRIKNNNNNEVANLGEKKVSPTKIKYIYQKK